ncbi:MAG: YqzL family protein [Halanaerobiales bacterium]|nr:YqzL family protein [Halanaerobiales bacterium]
MGFLGITASLFWKLFEETGSVDAYLAYRSIFRTEVRRGS